MTDTDKRAYMVGDVRVFPGGVRAPVKVALADAATAGGVAAIANPFGAAAYITRIIVSVTTVATAAATIDAGVAADDETLSDDLIDGLDVNAATGLFDNIVNAGTNGKALQPWGASEYVTISEASGDVSDLEGYVYIHATPQ